MRLVRLDELTYCLYSGMGAWGHRQRLELASGDWRVPQGSRPALSHAEAVAKKLYGCEFYADPSGPALSPEELVELIAELVRKWPKTLREGFASNVQKDRDWTRYHAAHWLADQLADFTILRDAPEPPGFRFANFEGGSGPVAVSAEDHVRQRQKA